MADRSGDEKPVFLFDGDCGFCRRWAAWLGCRAGSAVQFRAFQDLSEEERFGLTFHQLKAASYLVDQSGTAHQGSDAFAQALSRGKGTWAVLGRVIALRGVRRLARFVYGVVSQNRHRLPAP